MQNKIIITEDGSHTIYVPALEEHYHSTYGAINESMHIYINAGLKHHPNKKLTVLEIGFGTGLNAYLSLATAIQEHKKIDYYSIEKYPLIEAEYKILNYSEQIFPEFANKFQTMHRLEWNISHQMCSEFRLKKIQADLKTFEYDEIPKADIIYFDAFGPDKQPEMWTQSIFEKIATHTNPGGIIATYCAKGTVRRMLDSLGFQMERLPGPTGKKEILRGIKRLDGN